MGWAVFIRATALAWAMGAMGAMGAMAMATEGTVLPHLIIPLIIPIRLSLPCRRRHLSISSSKNLHRRQRQRRSQRIIGTIAETQKDIIPM